MIERDIENIQETIKDIKIEIEQIEIENNKNIKNEDYNKAVLDKLTKNQVLLEQEIEKIQYEFKNIKEKRDVISNELTSKKIIYAEKIKTSESIENEILRLEKDLKIINQKIDSDTIEIENIENKILAVENDQKTLKSQ